MIYSGKTNIGKVRLVNQDSFAIKSFANDVLVAVVCDGMGGVRGGNIASETAIEAFMKSLENTLLADLNKGSSIDATKAMTILAHAVYDANEAVYNKAIGSPELMGMGTTLVACMALGKRLYVTNVGDSRLYIDSGKKLSQITEDHSYVQFLVDVGDITPEEAKNHPYKNRITRAVGIQPSIDCDMFTVNLDPDAKVLLCSDGLCGQVEDNVMHKLLKNGSKKDSIQKQLDKSVDLLIEEALDNGGPDNITVVLLSASDN